LLSQVGETSQLAAKLTRYFAVISIAAIENAQLFQFGTPRALFVSWPDGRVRENNSRGLTMFTSFNSTRNAATALAGAFITALLFVSAATSLPIA
jgi:hypothetical protein